MEAFRPRSLDAGAPLPTAPTSAELAAFAASLSGSVILPDDVAYDESREVHNSRFDRRPELIVRVADADDVAGSVRFATRHGFEIAVRSGGHSLKGDGTTDGGLVIDLSALKGLLIDPEGRLAWAQTGLTAGEVTAAAAAHGLAVPFGDTASVGIGGLTTGGGIGFLARKHGLTVDHVAAAELVTADGRILTVDEEHHPDLFWAIRGGGGNVGIVTRFVYRLVEVGMVVGGGLALPATADAIAGLVRAAREAPDELTLISYVMFAPPLPFIPAERVGQLMLFVLGVYDGELDAGQAAWAPIRALGEPIADLVGPMPYSAIHQFTDAGTARGGGSIRSWFTDDLTIADADCIVALMRDAGSPAVMTQIRVLGGAMARVAPGATAFSQRDASVLVAAMSLFEVGADAAPADAWTTRVFDAFAARVRGVYANFLGDEGQERIRSAYPHGAYETLASIKRRHDPRNVFRLNQNVPPA
ncbi:MAG TPA: FAD-binding oxidoreductase [Candidatus Limnocylindrales bacterium]|nr:FAD-binding oxidoreductase [Candidatus Limnocylindrales bacterium]